jgi:hypothetical protein
MEIVRDTPRTKRLPSPGAPALAGLVALVLLCAAVPSAQGEAAHENRAKPQKRHPAPRPAYWGAWIGDQLTGEKAPWDMGAVSKLEQLLGKSLSLVEFSSPFADCHTSVCSYYDFPTTQMERVRSYGAIPVFSWSSSASPEEANQQPYRLANIINGSLDSYIRGFAEAARRWGHPFFLRLDWEMNGNWFPWAEGLNGNGPGEYIAAWRHVHDIFTSVGAVNASWVWCPYADPSGKFGRIGQLYPGDGYVDWTCMDGYNWAKNPANPHPWRSFDRIFSSTYRKLTQRIAPEKPIMLGELASTGQGQAKATWIRKMFRSLSTSYRRVRALIWFDQVDRGVDWPLETSPAASRAFSTGLKRGAFKGNSQAGVSASPIPPPG